MAQETEQYPLTLDDLRDALYVGTIDGIRFEYADDVTTREIIRHEVYHFERFDSVYETYLEYFVATPEQPKPCTRAELRDDLERTEVQARVEQYERGKAILQVNKVVTSGRSIVLGDRSYEEMADGETIVSPALVCWGGHIATSEAHYYAALARRKGVRK